eukprot:TRINITY_DN7352_c0_g2_i1.p2 TRINITY_DN7352_c0_g2~~TRINITY_DN7352_c0_g2_i1.p2  ORF type:complete len:284 (-),score=41.09 TRINITY_DN7352_c0_g2_i1:582-1433(-)
MQGWRSSSRNAARSDMERLLFSDGDDWRNWTAKPQRIRTIVNILASKLPLGPFHKTAVPFPSTDAAARDNGQSALVQKLVVVSRTCVIEKAESLYGPDPKMALATARVTLAYLQYWHSFDSWAPSNVNPAPDLYRQIGLTLFDALVWRVMHRQRPALLELMTAHGPEVIAAMLSGSSGVSAKDQAEKVLKSVDELLRPGFPGMTEPLARALWHGGVAERAVRLTLRPADNADERDRRTSAMLCAVTIARTYVESPRASISIKDPLLQLLSSAVRCVLRGELQA